jgi:glycosyltransferase involved in cell wall biosynthesis
LNSEWMAAHLGHPQHSIVVRPPVDPAAYETTPGDLVTQISLTEGKGGHLFWAVAKALPGTSFLAVRGSYGDQILPDPVPANVTVTGPFDGRRMREQVYARTRILLVPSDYESWGRVATEAMCSGIPVIAHRAEGGLAENLGDAAIWADRGDPGTWVQEIQRLSKRAAWNKASEACRKRSAELDPSGDLERWCDAVEALVP